MAARIRVTPALRGKICIYKLSYPWPIPPSMLETFSPLKKDSDFVE
jgi:hypothetical protein